MPYAIDDLRTGLEREREEIERVLAMHSGPGAETEFNAAHSLFLAWQKINEAIAILTKASLAAKDQPPAAKDAIRRASIAERIETLHPNVADKLAAATALPQPTTQSTQGDDFTRIRRIDDALARNLQDVGVLSFQQMADFTASDVHRLSALLGLGRQVSSENWIEQAALLARVCGAGDETVVAPAAVSPDLVASKLVAEFVSRAANGILSRVPAPAVLLFHQAAELPGPTSTTTLAVEDFEAASEAVTAAAVEPPLPPAPEVMEPLPEEQTPHTSEASADIDERDDGEGAAIVIVPRTLEQPTDAAADVVQGDAATQPERDQPASLPVSPKIPERAGLTARLDRIDEASVDLISDFDFNTDPPESDATWDDHNEAEVVIVPRPSTKSPPSRNGRIVTRATELADWPLLPVASQRGYTVGREPVPGNLRTRAGLTDAMASVEIKLPSHGNSGRAKFVRATRPLEPPPPDAPLSRFFRALKGK